MKLKVKSVSNESQPVITIDIPGDATVDHFRTVVATALTVSADRVRLVFAGKILENGHPLSAFDVFEDASIITIINSKSVTNEQISSSPRNMSTLVPTNSKSDLDSSGNFCNQSAKKPKLDGLAGSSLVSLLKELTGLACEFSSEHIHLKYNDQIINDDNTLSTLFPLTSFSEVYQSKTTAISRSALEKMCTPPRSHVLITRITREVKSGENLVKSFDVVCEIEKDDNSLTAYILQVNADLRNITLSSMPSSKPNEDHSIDNGNLSWMNPAELTNIFFYDGTAKFIRNLVAKEYSVKTYKVFLEFNGDPVYDDQHLTAYCIHNGKNVSCQEHKLQHRVFSSPIEEIAWRMNNDVCSKREFLSYIAGLPEVEPLTADPKNIRKMLLTHPLLKRVHKQFSEIKRILQWDDYLLYRMKMFRNQECLPSSDHISLDPIGWNQLMIDWPVVQQLYGRYPEIRPILMWEEYLLYRTNLMTNPSFLELQREVIKNQDRAMAQYERYSEYSNFMLNVNQNETESTIEESHPGPSASEVSSYQNQNYTMLSEPGNEIRSSDDDWKTYIANISKFAYKLLKYCPQFNDAVNCNPYMQSFMNTLANDSRLIEGIIEEVTPDTVMKDPRLLSWAKEEIPKIMKQLYDAEGLKKLSILLAEQDDYLDPASQVMNAIDFLQRAGYPVQKIHHPADQ